MATLPTEESLGFAPPDPGGGRRIIIPNEGAVGNAYANLGNQGERTGLMLIDKAQQQKQGDQDLQMAGASSALLRSQLDLEQKYKDDPDYLTMPQRYEADLGKAKLAALGAITDPRAKLKFGFAADDVIARSVFDMKNTAATKQKDATAGYTTTLLDSNLQAATNTKDPHAQMALLDASLAALDAGQKQGVYTAEQVAAEKVKYKANFAKSVLGSMSTPDLVKALGGNPDVTPAAIPATGATGGSLANNVGNIRASGAAFDGKGAPQNGFETFATPQAGVAALVTNLKSYGDISLRDAIYKWAPPSENNSAAYLASVVKATGLNPDMPVPTGDVAKMATLAKAMTGVEKGGVKFDDVVFRQGADAAINGTPLPKPADAGTQLASLGATDATGTVPATPQAGGQPSELAMLLGGDDRQTLLDAATRQLGAERNRAQADQDKQLAAVRAQTEADLGVKLERGEASYTDLDLARQNGSISPSFWSTQTQALDKQNAENATNAQLMAKADMAGKGGVPLDPKNPGDVKGLNMLFNATAATWKDLPPDQAMAAALAFTIQKGLVPEKVQSMVRGGLRSGDPNQAILAADTLQQMRNANPQLLNDFSQEDIRLGNLIDTYTSDGVPPAKAVEMANASMNVNEVDRKARDADYDAQRGKTPADQQASDQKWLSAQVPGTASWYQFWRSNPEVGSVARGEFDNLSRLEFERTGDLEASRKTAMDYMNRVWGVTQVAGPARLQKFAPERFYGIPNLSPDDNAKWMNEQLLSDVGKGAMQDPSNPLSVDRLMVTPDPTRTDDQGRPTYQVSVKGADGLLYAVTGKDGKPLPWTPNWDTSAEKLRRDALIGKGVNEARDIRAGKTPQDTIDQLKALSP